MKNWFLEKFLPMWAKETVLKDNKALQRRIRALERTLEEKEAYIRGLEIGSKVACQVARALGRGGST